jgi:hypothetical protein
MPRPLYRLAMETTSRRFAGSDNLGLVITALDAPRHAESLLRVSKAGLPISLSHIRTEVASRSGRRRPRERAASAARRTHVQRIVLANSPSPPAVPGRLTPSAVGRDAACAAAEARAVSRAALLVLVVRVFDAAGRAG